MTINFVIKHLILRVLFGNQFNVTIKQDRKIEEQKSQRCRYHYYLDIIIEKTEAIAVLCEPCKHLVKYISICYNSFDKVARDNLGYIRKNKL